MMNKLLLLFIAIVFISACSKKSSTLPVITTSPIAGKWYFSADTTVEYLSDGSLLGTFNTDPGTWAYLQFNNDFTGTSQESRGDAGDTTSYVAKFNYKLSGNMLIINYPSQLIGGELFATTIDTGQILINTGSKLKIYYQIHISANAGGGHYLETQYLAK